MNYCTHSRMVILHYAMLQGEVMLLVWNISFPLLVLMWILHFRQFITNYIIELLWVPIFAVITFDITNCKFMSALSTCIHHIFPHIWPNNSAVLLPWIYNIHDLTYPISCKVHLYFVHYYLPHVLLQRITHYRKLNTEPGVHFTNVYFT